MCGYSPTAGLLRPSMAWFGIRVGPQCVVCLTAQVCGHEKTAKIFVLRGKQPDLGRCDIGSGAPLG